MSRHKNWVYVEQLIGRKLNDGDDEHSSEPVLRSCYKCNSSHTWMKDKKLDMVFMCFECGGIYYRGKEIHKELEKLIPKETDEDGNV